MLAGKNVLPDICPQDDCPYLRLTALKITRTYDFLHLCLSALTIVCTDDCPLAIST